MGATAAGGAASDDGLRAAPAATRRWWAGHESELPEGDGWLSPPERARVADLRFTKRRTEYLLRRWAGKRAVAALLDRPHDEASLAGVEVLNRLTGAPFVRLDGSPTPVAISLTDRAGCAVAVVGRQGTPDSGPLGVDLELVEPRSEGFVSDFLTPAEQHWVGSRGSDPVLGRDAAANLVWSAKEAALKVLQLGLRADTRWVEIAVGSSSRPDGWTPFTATWRQQEVLPGWWRRDGRYLLTIASRHEDVPPEALPGTLDLAAAEPVHRWLDAPLVTPRVTPAEQP